MSGMSNTVILDFDVPYEKFGLEEHKNISWAIEVMGLINDFKEMIIRKSYSGNTHVYLRFKRQLMPIEVLALEWLSGSDYLRMLWEYKRVKCGYPYRFQWAFNRYFRKPPRREPVPGVNAFPEDRAPPPQRERVPGGPREPVPGELELYLLHLFSLIS